MDDQGEKEVSEFVKTKSYSVDGSSAKMNYLVAMGNEAMRSMDFVDELTPQLRPRADRESFANGEPNLGPPRATFLFETRMERLS